MVKILKNIGRYYRIGLYSRAEALSNIRDLLEEAANSVALYYESFEDRLCGRR